MFTFKNILFILLILSIFVLSFCDSSSKKEKEKTDLEQAQEKLVTYLNQSNPYNALTEENIRGDKFTAMEIDKGYLVTVANGSTKGAAKGYMLPLNITKDGEFVVMIEDDKNTEFKAIDGKSEEIKIKNSDTYQGKKYIVFDYKKKQNDISATQNVPYITFKTTSQTFKIAFTEFIPSYRHDLQ